jgi:RimJ/RimL family protein N-acetyltransferase
MIVTPRLVLRAPVPADIAFRRTELNTPQVQRFLGGPAGDAAVEAAFARDVAAFEQDGFGFWVVARREDNQTIGRCGLATIARQPEAIAGRRQIGWAFAEPFWGQGYAAEAAGAALDYAFGVLGEEAVYAQTSASNTASTRLMERLGFVRRADLDYHDVDFCAADNPTTIHCLARADWSAKAAA